MAVVSVGIRPGFPTGEESLEGRKYVCEWLVIVDDFLDGPVTVQAAPGLPAAYDTFAVGNDFDLLARLRKFSANRLTPESKFQWVVRGEWSTPPMKSGLGNTGTGGGTHTDTAGDYQNPLLELPTLKCTAIEREVIVDRILNQQTGLYNAPMNSACQIFVPALTKKDNSFALTISRNEPLSANHPQIGITYNKAVNSDVFFGNKPGTAQIHSITYERATKQIAGGVTVAFLRVEYTIHFNGDGFVRKILDSGDYYCTGAGGSGSGMGFGCGNCPTKIGFRDQQQHPIQGLLDGMGGPLPAGANPVFMQFNVYNSLPFAPLNLPQNNFQIQ